MIRAVIDTNVFVSGATGTSYPAQAIKAWENQQFILITPEKITVDLIKNDPADNKFIASALEGFADYIVTGDNHLLSVKHHQGISIIKPSQFLKTLKSSNSPASAGKH